MKPEKAAKELGIKDPEQHKAPNFVSNGKLYLVRCYKCDPEFGVENYALAVSSGQCSWCGWSE